MPVERAPAKPESRSRRHSPAPRGETAARPRIRTRILVIDEKGIMRDGLCVLLGSTREFEIVGTESSTADGLRSASASRPDVIVADFPHIKADGSEAITRIKARLPEVRMLILTFHQDDHIIDGALRAGTDGYVLKNDSCNELFRALRSVAAGKGFISPSIRDRIASRYARGGEPMTERGGPESELTNRERQVMRLIAAGHRTREIAQLLSLSHKTIEKHRTSLMRKLGLRNASAVAAYAIAHGLG
jgi:two-component system, NarL family, response regulator NreC